MKGRIRVLTLGSVVIKNINLFHDMSHDGRIRKMKHLKNKTCDEVLVEIRNV